MSEKNYKKDESFGQVIRYLSLVSHIGITMIVAIGICFAAGFYLENRFHKNGMILTASIILGVISGFFNVYNLLKKSGIFIDKQNHEK